MTIADERLAQIAREAITEALRDAYTDTVDQGEILHDALGGWDGDGDWDELLGRFDAALDRARAEILARTANVYQLDRQRIADRIEQAVADNAELCGDWCIAEVAKTAVYIVRDGHNEDHPETRCHRCGGPNIAWAAPSPLWNEVMRDGDISADDDYDGIVCPTCFATIAEQAGIAGLWQFTARRVNRELTTVTPSGRVWDERAWLWIDPEAVSRDGWCRVSVCISRHGEYSSHELDDLHTCTLCGVLDEDALRAELVEAQQTIRAKTADVEHAMRNARAAIEKRKYAEERQAAAEVMLSELLSGTTKTGQPGGGTA